MPAFRSLEPSTMPATSFSLRVRCGNLGRMAAVGWMMVMLPLAARADFEEMGHAARPWGMANAYSALALDHLALFYNPAGLAAVTNTEVGTGYNRYWAGLTDQSNIGSGYFAVALPVSSLTSRFPGGLGVAYLTTYLSGAYAETTMTVGYGVELNEGFVVGAALKLLSSSVTADAYLAGDPLFAKGYASSAATVDIGFMVRNIPAWNFSFSILNALPANMALKGEDTVPMRVKGGAAYRIPGWDFSGDVTWEAGELATAVGMEKRFSERLYFVRGGLGWGAREYRVVTLGAGVNLNQVQLDYAFFLPFTGPTGAGGSHRVSMLLRFGEPMTSAEDEFKPQHLVPKEVYDQDIAKLKKELQDSYVDVDRLHKAQSEDRTQLENAVKLVMQLSEKLERLEREGQKVRVIERIVEKPAPKPVRPTSYTVKEGDTLKSISQELYGDEEKWVDLLKANQEKIRQGMVTAGQVLVVP